MDLQEEPAGFRRALQRASSWYAWWLEKERVVPKQKTHRGAAKRFKLTSKGKVKRGHSMRSHILTKKSTKRKRRLRKQTLISKAFEKQIREML